MLRTLLPPNEGFTDRITRAVVGAGILSLAFVGPASPWGYLGLILLATATIGSCPFYTLFGMSTCPTAPL